MSSGKKYDEKIKRRKKIEVKENSLHCIYMPFFKLLLSILVFLVYLFFKQIIGRFYNYI